MKTIYKNSRGSYSVYAGKGFLKNRKLLLRLCSYNFFRRNYNCNKLGYKKLYASFVTPETTKSVYRKGIAKLFTLKHEPLNTLTPLTFAEYAAIITYKD